VKKEKSLPEKEKNYCKFKSGKTLWYFSQAKLVLEAFIEDLVIKQAVFCELETMLAEDLILATNT